MFREILILLLGASCVAFTIAAIFSFVSFVFGLDLEMYDAPVPNDLPAVIFFAVIAVLCGVGMWFLARKGPNPKT